MQTWLTIDEFAKLVGKSIEEIKFLCKQDKLHYKKENGKIYIEAESSTKSLIPIKTELKIIEQRKGSALEKTIATILALHEKILEAKDETIESLKSENEFLKSTLLSVQEVYDEDRKTIKTLQTQLKICQEELEYCKKKYRLMWGQVLKKGGKIE